MAVFKESPTRQTLPPIVVGVFTLFVNLLTFSTFHPLLPDLVHQILVHYDVTNSTDVNLDVINSTIVNYDYDVMNSTFPSTRADKEKTVAEDDVIKAISYVTGAGSISVVIASLSSSHLIRLLGYRVVMVTTGLMTLATPIICCYSNHIALLCLANVLVNFSMTVGYVFVFSIFAHVVRHDSDRSIIVNISTVMGSLAYVIGYSATSAVYQFFGKLVNFWSIATVALSNGIFLTFVPLKMEPRDLRSENQTEDAKTRRSSNAESFKSHKSALTNIHVILAVLQMSLVYVAMATLWTTGPEWVLRQLETSQWQTGLIMGLGAASEILGVTMATFIVTTPTLRWKAILVSIFLMGSGFLAYPFPRVVWYLLPSEISIRCCKAMIFTFQASLYPYIFDKYGLGAYDVGFGIFSMSCAMGTIVGTFGSAWVLGLIGFQWLYISLGVILITVSLTAAHFRLLEQIEQHPSAGVGEELLKC